MVVVRVQEQEFDIAKEQINLVGSRKDIGAIVAFTGLVRDITEGRKLSKMVLEHYPEMAESELGRLESEANKRFDLQGTTIIHRYGELFPGDLIVLVLAASQHRQDAFSAADFMMDYLKSNAPFWKKEYYTDKNEPEWVNAKTSDDERLNRWF